MTDGPIWKRPETFAIGRPAERSRAQITAAAITLADAEGLDAVTMRRVASAMGTGPASLYRYVKTRDELLDLMIDAVAAEYRLTPPTPNPRADGPPEEGSRAGESPEAEAALGGSAEGDWLGGVVEVARQTRDLMGRHPWLTVAMPLRPTVGPHSLALLEHVLATLAGHPASGATKLQAYAILNGVIGLIARAEHTGLGDRQAELTGYLRQVTREGGHPHLAAALADGRGPDGFDDVVTRIMTGLLGPAA
ncbi:TetR/AcrR family transcriptional regulator [Actinoplanes sp. NPDC051470]|uniref:TetR/AcrR family transcriptional regulator n=1 Tax=Actinoplanes sp. NPDC051470 TaxID=3157224 RepID=UPI00342C9C2A